MNLPRRPSWLSPARARLLRIIAIVLFGLLASFLAFFAIHRGLLPVVAAVFPSLHVRFYDLAVWGAFPVEKYVSFNLPSPKVNVLQWDDSCGAGHVLIAPYGTADAHAGPTILNARGELVWTTDEYGESMNFRMQRYKGEDFLTFWAGRKKGSVGWGTLFMLDSHYNVAHRVQAVGDNVKGDLHEFEITDDGTALVTVYNETQADLTAMGWGRSSNGWIVDSIFQEIDIATGDLLFEWRASDHHDPAVSFYTHPIGGYFKSIPFDFYHINSMQKDSKGNYLICSRHLHTISYLNGTNGEVLWSLGGDSTDFTDLSDGAASDFTWQHHARWADGEKGLLTVFDNGCAGPLHVDAPHSKATLLQLDTANMTAEHIASYTSLGSTRAASQGSAQLLPGGDRMFIGWGSSAAWSEHDVAGELKCELHFAASSTFYWERVKNYRAYKIPHWKAQPEYPPSARLHNNLDDFFVSWNGATEIDKWQFQGAKDGYEDFDRLQTNSRSGFEERFLLPPRGQGGKDAYVRFRAAALDDTNNIIGISNWVERPRDEGRHVGWIVFGVLCGIAAGLGVWYALKFWAKGGQFRLPFAVPGVERGKRALGGAWATWGGAEKYTYSRL